jgi:signal transduction histidine kinase
VGCHVLELLPLPPAQWISLFNEFMLPGSDGGKSQPDGEFEAQRRAYQYRLFPIQLGEGERQVGLVIWDITEQKHLREQLIQTEKLASLGTLVSGMAHEINNPIQGILGMAEIIKDETDPAKIREYASDIADYSRHVATVVRDFACYARPSARDEEIPIDLNERMAEAVKMVRRSPQFGHVSVVTDFTAIPHVQARRTEIDQVFVNLISNAVQAMGGKGQLTLATSATNEAVLASVTDTGCGIPKTIMSKIFDPFFTTKDPGKGTGLGLSVVYKIMSKYGGRVDVASREGAGTTFTVHFPLENVPGIPTTEEVCDGSIQT